MLWKILLGLGLCGILACIVFIAISLRSFYAASFHSTDEDIAFAGFLAAVLGLIISALIALVALIFVMKNSKKAFDAGK